MKKNILIVGGNSDIAQNLFEILTKKNFKVFFFVRKNTNLLKLNKNSKIIKNDIRNKEKTFNSIKYLKKNYKYLDYLIINASITDNKIKPFTLKNITNIFELNFFANIRIVFFIIKIFKKSLKKVIHISSDVTKHGNLFLPGYSSSKSAVDNLFLSLEKKYKKKINFISVKLGPVLTSKIRKTKTSKWIINNKKRITYPNLVAKKIFRLIKKK